MSDNSSIPTDKASTETVPTNFIRNIINQDLASGKHTSVCTRFPPEPNGFLHIGHAKSICINFGIAQDYNGKCNLRFDDTNPAKEESIYAEAIAKDVEWLGYQWDGEIRHSADYFEKLYNYAEELNNSFEKDTRVGYTTVGTHRSDILVKSNNKPVKESGSMSTLVLSCLLIFLAKSSVFHVKHGYKPVLLIDDLFFGIDNKNLKTVIKLLIYSKSNIVVSAPNIYKEILEEISSKYDEIELINAGEF